MTRTLTAPSSANRPAATRTRDRKAATGVLGAVVAMQRTAGNAATSQRVTAKKKPRPAIDDKVVDRIAEYDEIIDRLASQEHVDAAIVRGIIAAESSGKADEGHKRKTSYKGLMQAEQGEEQLTPENSIRTGIKVYQGKEASLNKTLAKYGGSLGALALDDRIRLVMTAYNAGQGTVKVAMASAAKAGDVAKWNDAEHWQTALAQTGAYNVHAALDKHLGEMRGDELAAALHKLTDTDPAASFHRNGWDEPGLRTAIVARLEHDRVQLRKTKNLTHGQVKEQASELLWHCIDFKSTNRTGYVNKVVAYTHHYKGLAVDGTQGSQAAEQSPGANARPTAAAPTAAPTHQPPAAPTTTSGQITSGRLGDFGNAQETAFRRAVFDAQLAENRAQHKNYQPDLMAADLAEVEDGHRLHKDAAGPAKALLNAARDALAAAQAKGDQDALKVQDIGIASAYRTNERDFKSWQDAFTTWYAKTGEERAKLPGGALGPASVTRMLRAMATAKALPGYSNHTNGRAIDFFALVGRHLKLGPSSSQKAAWKKSWLFRWLDANAVGMQFKNYWKEPWHWDHVG
jgi:hypothetical protein